MDLWSHNPSTNWDNPTRCQTKCLLVYKFMNTIIVYLDYGLWGDTTMARNGAVYELYIYIFISCVIDYSYALHKRQLINL